MPEFFEDVARKWKSFASKRRSSNRIDENAASVDVELDDDALAQLQPLSDQVQGGRYADHGVR